MEVEVLGDEELAGSYSPQLLHGDEDEDEEAIDPEEDKAILVIWLNLFKYFDLDDIRRVWKIVLLYEPIYLLQLQAPMSLERGRRKCKDALNSITGFRLIFF